MKEKTYEIFTDSSFDNKTKIAVYSIVIMQEKKIVKAFAKKCRLHLENSTECEVFAVFQAINIIETNLIKRKKLLQFLQEFNSKQCKVLIYLCLISSEDKFVIKTQNDISKALELSS